MSVEFPTTLQPWISLFFTIALLMTFVVMVLLALGAGVMAIYAAFHKEEPPGGRRHKTPKGFVDMSWYELYDVQPSKPAAPRVQRRPTIEEIARELGLRGFGVMLLSQSERSEAVPVVFVIALLLILLAWILVESSMDHGPRQRSFEDYREELRRESGRYLDRISRFLRRS
jgi:hypothetical protein